MVTQSPRCWSALGRPVRLPDGSVLVPLQTPEPKTLQDAYGKESRVGFFETHEQKKAEVEPVR
jgi:hypothetical protein